MSWNTSFDGILSPTFLTAILVVIFITFLFRTLRYKGVPPGPTGLPYLGYWPFLSSKTGHLQLEKLKNRYGDVFSFTVTGKLYINLASAKALREAHVANADAFSDRPKEFTLFGHFFEDGIFSCNGESWKVHRKLFLQVMKNRNVTSVRDNMSTSLYDLVASILHDLKPSDGSSINILDVLSRKCATVMKMTLFGEIGISDEQIRTLNELYVAIVGCISPLNALLTGNIVRYLILPLRHEYRDALRNLNKIEDILYGIIKEHKDTYSGDHLRNVIDDYINEKEQRLTKKDPSAQYFTDKALARSLLQFVGDGVSFVAFTISVGIKCLLEYPEEQDKIYAEIVDVVGLDRGPTLEDKPKLTYLNAFMWEAFRTSDLFSFLPGLECSNETHLCGFRIPKGAVTIVNLYSIHHDETLYREASTFDPSRFISSGETKGEPLPITFGVGKRSCLGEGFVMAQLFLFIATIVQKFHLQFESNSSDLTFEQVLSGDIHGIATPRKH